MFYYVIDKNHGDFCPVSVYKIRDDSVRPRQFLSTDAEDGIEAILTDHQGHSLHELIDGDDSLRPVINFDLSNTRKNLINSIPNLCV